MNNEIEQEQQQYKAYKVKFRAPKKRSKYKKIDNYLEAVWRKNKDVIEQNMEDYSDSEGTILYTKRSKKERWKRMVKQIYKAHEFDKTLNRNIKNIDEAIDVATRSVAFKYDFRIKNVIEGTLKAKAPDEWKEIRERIGKTTHFDYSKLQFVGYGTNNDVWQKYEYERAEKIKVVITRGKNKGKTVYRYTGNKAKRQKKVFYLVWHISSKEGSDGYYTIEDKLPKYDLTS